MTLQHACFISYRHYDSPELRQLVSQLHDELKTQLALLMDEKPYWDEQLYYGEQFRNKLAETLCESVCMVVLYSPVYCESKFCRSEFLGMLNLQEQRLQALGQPNASAGMIIPIILKRHPKDHIHKQDWLPPQIEDRFNYCDISQFVLRSTRKLRNNAKFREQMQRIAEDIARIRSLLKSHPGTVSINFTLPADPEPWLTAAAAAPSTEPVAPFPLR